MPTTDPIQILLAHDHWATRQILTACEKLTPEQFHQKFEMGPGSLHATISHMLGAMQTWTQTLQGGPLGSRIDHDGQSRSPAQLLEVADAVYPAFAAEARRLPLDQIATRVREGKEFRLTRAAIVTHVATHSMHHRAQCLNMLRQLGIKPLPPSGIAEWTRLADPD